MESYKYSADNYPFLKEDMLNYYRAYEKYNRKRNDKTAMSLHIAWEMLYFSIKHGAVIGIYSEDTRNEMWQYFCRDGLSLEVSQ